MDPYGERRKVALPLLGKKSKDFKVWQRRGSKEGDGSLQLMRRFINYSAGNGQADLQVNGKENFIGIRRNCAKFTATPENKLIKPNS